MRKTFLLGMGVCMVLMFSSCKSSESAYKKIYEKAKQNELAQQPAEASDSITSVVPMTPVVAQPPVQTEDTRPTDVREERVMVVSGHEDGLKNFSVVCGSYQAKTNAEALKTRLEGEGYTPLVVYNAEKNTYRVVVSTFDDKPSAAKARDEFKAKYPGNADFQKAWLLYRMK